MKKIFLFALAAISLVACKENNSSSDEPKGDKPVVAFKTTSVSVEVSKTVTLEVAVTPQDAKLAWEIDKPAIASVANGVVTGVAEGNAIVTVTATNEAGSSSAKCIVNVIKQGGGDTPKVKGSKIWPIVMDGTTSTAIGQKLIYDYRPDDINKFLYVWENTYVAGAASGKNFYQTEQGEGSFTCLQVGSVGWSGCGYCMTSSDGTKPNPELFAAMKAMVDEIKAAPADYFLHLAIKSTDQCAHCFYFLGSEATKFVLGASSVYDGPVYGNFTRDGSWAEFDIPMSNYAAAIETIATTGTYDGMNIFVALSDGAVPGALLNLDAVYFYKK